MEKEKLELAWAAGLFDGEGCSHKGLIKHKWSTKNGTKEGTYLHRNLSMNQYHDPEVLVRFVAAVETGKVYGPYTNKVTGNAWWQVHLGVAKSIAVLTKLFPYLSGPKKKQALDVFPELKDLV